MNTLGLTDLDELVLTVRDKVSQSYILEAINAYRGRAYRAAIISTWIAVSYDIIAKIRELVNQGDKAAIAFITKLDAAIARNDITQLSVIEQSLLDEAYNVFEFLLKHECDDLKRLKDDRNLCAHPAFVDVDILFQPTAELIRTHIVHAVIHLLRHQPVQGKSALLHILTDIKRPSFPSDVKSISAFLNSKYLDRAKDALIRNLIRLLIKTLLKTDDPDLRDKERQIVYSLISVAERHSAIYEQVMAKELLEVAKALDDDQLTRIFTLLGAESRCWGWLNQAVQIQIKEKLKNFFKDQDQKSLYIRHKYFGVPFLEALVIDDLNELALNEFETFTPLAQSIIIARNPRLEFLDKAIDIYSKAEDFTFARYLGEMALLPMAPYFQPDHVKKILNIARSNDQIWHAPGTSNILEQLFDKTIKHLTDTKDAWHNFLSSTQVPKFNIRLDYSGLHKKLEACE